MKKTKVKMNKPVYLGMSILDISKTLMYEFWYDYIKPKYKEKAKLCYMVTDSLLLTFLLKTFLRILIMVLKDGLDRSNYDNNDKKPLLIGKNKRLIRMFRDELGGKIIKEFCAPRAKTYAYSMDDDIENKKAKGTKKCIIKHRIKFKDYKDSIYKNKTIIRSQLRFKSDLHIVYTEEMK